jgi:hypothetical protein
MLKRPFAAYCKHQEGMGRTLVRVQRSCEVILSKMADKWSHGRSLLSGSVYVAAVEKLLQSLQTPQFEGNTDIEKVVPSTPDCY